MSPSDEQKLANKFHRYGWLGVWVQLVLGILPLAMLCYVLLGKATGENVTLGLMDYMALGGLVVLAFTMFWSYRYTRLARRITDPERRPEWSAVARMLRVGIWASSLGIVISLLLMIIEVLRLLFLFLKTPQAGVPVIRTEAGNRTAWVSAIDVVSLLAEICTLVGELMIIAFTLWLLFALLKHIGVFGRLDDPATTASAKR